MLRQVLIRFIEASVMHLRAQGNTEVLVIPVGRQINTVWL